MSETPPTLPSKARSDSKLEKLTAEQKQTLIDGLLGRWGYKEAIEWLREECGMTVNISSMTPFYRRYVLPIEQERKQFAMMSANELAAQAEESNVLDAAAIAQLKLYTFRLMRDPDNDSTATRKWVETLLKALKGEREKRKLDIIETKISKTTESEEEQKTKLTPEEQNRRLREILK